MTDAVRAFYGRHADLYDSIATLPGVRRWRTAAVDALDLAPGDTVVEFGCGSGANLLHLHEAVGPEGTVVGVDFTGPLLAVAEERAPEAHLVRGDATTPPVESADAVLATFVCGLLEDPAGAVDDWCDLVHPGGRLALMDATTSSHPVGRLFNPAFRAFTRGTAPADSLPDAVRTALSGGGASLLDDRVGAARKALVARGADRRFETVALGFVGLLSVRP